MLSAIDLASCSLRRTVRGLHRRSGAKTTTRRPPAASRSSPRPRRRRCATRIAARDPHAAAARLPRRVRQTRLPLLRIKQERRFVAWRGIAQDDGPLATFVSGAHDYGLICVDSRSPPLHPRSLHQHRVPFDAIPHALAGVARNSRRCYSGHLPQLLPPPSRSPRNGDP